MDLKIFLGLWGDAQSLDVCVRQTVIFIGAFSDLERKKKGLPLSQLNCITYLVSLKGLSIMCEGFLKCPRNSQ